MCDCMIAMHLFTNMWIDRCIWAPNNQVRCDSVCVHIRSGWCPIPIVCMHALIHACKHPHIGIHVYMHMHACTHVGKGVGAYACVM